MSLEAVIHRASRDSGFRQLLLSDPASALSGYDLSEEEMSALSTVKSSLKRGTRRGKTRQLPNYGADWY